MYFGFIFKICWSLLAILLIHMQNLGEGNYIEQESQTPASWTKCGLLFVLWLKLYWYTAIPICLCIVPGCFHDTYMNSCNRDHKDRKVWNSYYLAFYIKCLLISDLDNHIHFYVLSPPPQKKKQHNFFLLFTILIPFNYYF